MNDSLRPKELTPEEKRRLERVQSRRGRNRPSKVPARLVRTSAFAPKRRGLITDSSFERLYIVRGQSVVRVSGRELGTQHRDALYAVFRLGHEAEVQPDERSPIGYARYLKVKTTWRELLKCMGLTQHANNIAALHYTFEDIKKVVVTVYEGDEARLLEQYRSGKLPKAKGKMGNLLHDVEWTNLGLDDTVTIYYGEWTQTMVMSAKLVSLNADVQFALGSDYAKSFWPYIDSFHHHSWVDEDRLAELVGRNLWEEGEDAGTRRDFRSKCRKAFDDMVKASGLKSWRVEIRGDGRRKSHRYHYEHGLEPRQLELPMEKGEAANPGSPIGPTVSKPVPAMPATAASLALTPDVYDAARKAAPGWDVRALEEKWRSWALQSGKGAPTNADAAFVGFCRRHAATEGPPPSVSEFLAGLAAKVDLGADRD